MTFVGEFMRHLAADDYTARVLSAHEVASLPSTDTGSWAPLLAALTDAHRVRFMYSSLAKPGAQIVPLVRRCFELAAPGAPVVLFLPNAFAWRMAGRPVVEEILPYWDLTHVIDTSGAYIPGQGVPTMILAARARPPVDPTVRVTRILRGEPRTPENPACGLVWSSVVTTFDRPGEADEWTRCDDLPREQLAAHPWKWLDPIRGDA